METDDLDIEFFSNYLTLKELSHHEKIKGVECCTMHDDEKKLIYDLETNKFLCPICSLTKFNNPSSFIDIVRLVSKSHWKIILEKCKILANSEKKTKIIETLQERKKLLVLHYESCLKVLNQNYEKTMNIIEETLQHLNFDEINSKLSFDSKQNIPLESLLLKVSDIHACIYMTGLLEKSDLDLQTIVNLNGEIKNFFEDHQNSLSKNITDFFDSVNKSNNIRFICPPEILFNEKIKWGNYGECYLYVKDWGAKRKGSMEEYKRIAQKLKKKIIEKDHPGDGRSFSSSNSEQEFYKNVQSFYQKNI